MEWFHSWSAQAHMPGFGSRQGNARAQNIVGTHAFDTHACKGTTSLEISGAVRYRVPSIFKYNSWEG